VEYHVVVAGIPAQPLYGSPADYNHCTTTTTTTTTTTATTITATTSTSYSADYDPPSYDDAVLAASLPSSQLEKKSK